MPPRVFVYVDPSCMESTSTYDWLIASNRATYSYLNILYTVIRSGSLAFGENLIGIAL